jgi:hypothetical protein
MKTFGWLMLAFIGAMFFYGLAVEQEAALIPENLQWLQECAQRGRQIVQEPETDVATTIRALDRAIQKLQNSVKEEKQDFLYKLAVTELSLSLGSLWGETLVKEFGWSWAKMSDESGDMYYAVVSPDKVIVVCPLNDIRRCLTSPEEPYSFEKALNSLRETGKMLAKR